ncbi:MAG: hypothetical protein R3E84_02865 [Pseudomonadales bacterium]
MIFDVPVHLMSLDFKDVAPGTFNLEVQSIGKGDRLKFIPLRDGTFRTKGDGVWKSLNFEIRPQDLGWYKGADYQQYEVDQLQEMAAATNDTFLHQTREKQAYYLGFESAGQRAGNEKDYLRHFRIPARIAASSPTYAGFGFDRSLDADTAADYTAGIEGERGFVDLTFPQSRISEIRLVSKVPQTSRNKSAYRYRQMREQPSYWPASLATTSRNSGSRSRKSARPAHYTLTFSNFAGQPRILLRGLSILAADGEVMKVHSETEPPLTFTRVEGRFMDTEDPAGRAETLPPADFPVGKATVGFPVQERSPITSEFLLFHALYQWIRTGIASSSTPDATISERLGACGSFSNTLLAMGAAQNIPGRLVNFQNFTRLMMAIPSPKCLLTVPGDCMTQPTPHST